MGVNVNSKKGVRKSGSYVTLAYRAVYYNNLPSEVLNNCSHSLVFDSSSVDFKNLCDIAARKAKARGWDWTTIIVYDSLGYIVTYRSRRRVSPGVYSRSSEF